MSVYRPKNSPHFHFDFVIRGTRFHGSTGTASRRAAEAIEAKLRTEAAEGAIKRKPSMTMDIAAGRYWEEAGKFQASHKTTEYQLARLCTGIGETVLLSDIDGAAVAGYIAKRRAAVSDSSVNRELELLRRIMRRADSVWRVDIGEGLSWRDLMLREPDERIRELTASEEERLFTHLRQDLHPLVRFCMITGVRMSNAIGLTWSQIDFDAKVIRLMVKSKKPGGEHLAIPLIPTLVALLSAEQGRHETAVFTYECIRGRGDRKIATRHPLTATGWRKAWTRALKAASITDFRFHDLRHTAGTRVLRATGNLKAAQRLLGHRAITSTARYAHAMLDDVRDAMEAAVSRNSPGDVKPKNTKPLKNQK